MLFLYFVSGFAALLYEIVWLRVLALEIGHSAGAVSTVLAAFMGGLAGGALVGGRAAAGLGPRRALRVYATLELLILAAALALPLVLPVAAGLLAAGYGDGPTPAFLASRIAVCFVSVSIPAALMGATYPVAIRASQTTSRAWSGGGNAVRGQHGGRGARSGRNGIRLSAGSGHATDGVDWSPAEPDGGSRCDCPGVAAGTRARRQGRERSSGAGPIEGPASRRSCWTQRGVRCTCRGCALRLGVRRAALRGCLDACLCDGARADDLRVQHDARCVRRGHRDWRVGRRQAREG